jgi:tetratricopeptide (TPR) repeat protein
LLLLAALAGLAVWHYARSADQFLRQPALSQGTAGGAAYYQALNSMPEPGAAYLRGLGFQFDNDFDKAVEAYKQAPGIAGALNNLGAISSVRGDAAGSEGEYQQAAQLGSKIANHNLNSSTAAPGYRGAFHNAHRAGAPMLEVPSPRELAELRFGTLEQEFRRIALDPWGYLNALPLALIPPVQSVLAALVLLVLGLQVLWLLIPRVRTAANAPRSILYHIGAILIPGSGAADEVWGLLLLPPAIALIGLFIVQNYQLPLAESVLGRSSSLGISTVPPLLDLSANLQNLIIALIVVYAINFVAWFLETVAWIRRRQVATTSATTSSTSPTTPSNPN